MQEYTDEQLLTALNNFIEPERELAEIAGYELWTDVRRGRPYIGLEPTVSDHEIFPEITVHCVPELEECWSFDVDVSFPDLNSSTHSIDEIMEEWENAKELIKNLSEILFSPDCWV